MFDGSPATFELVKRPDTVEVIAVTARGEIVVCRETQPGKSTFVTLPGGRVDSGEDPLDAARRELQEETGYTGEKWKHLMSVDPSDNMIWTMHTYVVHDAVCTHPTKQDAGEQISVMLVPIQELFTIVAREDFRGAQLALYLLRLQQDPTRLADFIALLSQEVDAEHAPHADGIER